MKHTLVSLEQFKKSVDLIVSNSLPANIGLLHYIVVYLYLQKNISEWEAEYGTIATEFTDLLLDKQFVKKLKIVDEMDVVGAVLGCIQDFETFGKQTSPAE